MFSMRSTKTATIALRLPRRPAELGWLPLAGTGLSSELTLLRRDSNAAWCRPRGRLKGHSFASGAKTPTSGAKTSAPADLDNNDDLLATASALAASASALAASAWAKAAACALVAAFALARAADCAATTAWDDQRS